MKKYVSVTCRFILVFALVLSANNAYSQSSKKNLIGAHFAFGGGRYHMPLLLGAGYDTKYYYSTGLDYSRILPKSWVLCSGFEYTYSVINVLPTSGPIKEHQENVRLVNIPAHVKYHFGKYFFINGGFSFNVVAKYSQESVRIGYKPTNKLNMFLGCGLGIGFQHEFSSGLVLSLNPYIRWNGIENINDGKSFLKFMQVSGKIQGYQFRQNGLSLGVAYKL